MSSCSPAARSRFAPAYRLRTMGAANGEVITAPKIFSRAGLSGGVRFGPPKTASSRSSKRASTSRKNPGGTRTSSSRKWITSARAIRKPRLRQSALGSAAQAVHRSLVSDIEERKASASGSRPLTTVMSSPSSGKSASTDSTHWRSNSTLPRVSTKTLKRTAHPP